MHFNLHFKPAFQNCRQIGDLKNTELLYRNAITLPLHNELTHDLEVVDQYNAEIKGKLKAKVARIRNKLSKKYKYWAILVLPNGVVNSIGDDVLSDDFTNKISIYNLSILHVGGILQSYLDNKK